MGPRRSRGVNSAREECRRSKRSSELTFRRKCRVKVVGDMATRKTERTRRRRRRPATPDQLEQRGDVLARAAHLMQEKGYGSTSVQDIADAVNFSKANFFYHFHSKENLLYEIFVETLTFTINAIDTTVASDARPEDKLRAIADLYVRLAIERTAVMQVWWKEKGHLTRDHAIKITEMERRIGALLDRFYEEGVTLGAFRAFDTSLALSAIIGMCM